MCNRYFLFQALSLYTPLPTCIYHFLYAIYCKGALMGASDTATASIVWSVLCVGSAVQCFLNIGDVPIAHRITND